ncbi:MAG: hypothetical protein K8T89_10425 [Planctomycetes bacterium]|nr:hypothetical protein [Planctomycetota bacterium]
MSPLPAARALEQFFLDARCRLLDLAATLDRVGRGEGSESVNDPRLTRIHQALEILADSKGSRAERIQKLFSLEYDPNWKVPKPRY